VGILSELCGVSHEDLYSGAVGRAFGSIVYQYRPKLADRAIPPIVLHVVVVPSLDDALLHLAVAPLTEYSAGEEIVCTPDHLAKKTTWITVSFQELELDTEYCVCRRAR
jgi:hypothetical protein